MYKKILVPMDCSPVDEPILAHVGELAKVHAAELVLVRVAKAETRDAFAHEKGKAEEVMEKQAQKLRGKGLVVSLLVLRGDPPKEILEKAEELGCDLIAMGTHGHKGFQDWVLGSVADAVRHETKIPVLLIRG
jgi:manganese transport protein